MSTVWQNLFNRRLPQDNKPYIPVSSQDDALIALGDHQLTVTGAAAAVALPAIDAGTTEILLSIETNTVRMRLDNTGPTATTGHALAAGTIMTVSLSDFTKMKFYAASTAVVNYSCLAAS